MVETIAHTLREPQLPGSQPLLAQLPPAPIGLGYAASLAQVHHVAEAVMIEPTRACLMNPGRRELDPNNTRRMLTIRPLLRSRKTFLEGLDPLKGIHQTAPNPKVLHPENLKRRFGSFLR